MNSIQETSVGKGPENYLKPYSMFTNDFEMYTKYDLEQEFLDMRKPNEMNRKEGIKKGVNRVAILYTILFQFSQCVLYVIYKYLANSEKLNPLQNLFYRGIFMFTLSILWTFIYDNNILFSKEHLQKLVYRALSSVTISLSIMVSVSYGRLTTCEVIFKLGSVIVVFLSHFTLGEPIYRIDILAMIINITCIILVIKPTFIFGTGKDLVQQDSLLSIFAAFTYTIAWSFIRIFTKHLNEYFSAGVFIAFNAVSNSLIASILLFFASIPFTISLKSFVFLVFASLFDFAAQIFLVGSLKLELVNNLAPFNNVSLIFSSVNSVVFFGNIFDFYDFLGVSMMLVFFTYFSLNKTQ